MVDQWVRTRRRPAAVAGAAALCGYAVVATTTRPNTALALLALLIPIAVVAAGAMGEARTPEAAGSPQLRRTAVLWLSVITLALLWEAAAYVGEHTVGAYDHPTVSALLEPAMQQPPVRFAAWALWLFAGWRLVRR